jgi:hypothetical protein
MKTILLKFEKEAFYHFDKDKHRLENEFQTKVTWEEYFKIIFTQSKINSKGGIKKNDRK